MKIAEDGNENTTEVMKQINNELDKVKFKSFGKVTVRNELKTTKELKNLQEEKIEVIHTMDKTKDREEKIESLEQKITEKIC